MVQILEQKFDTYLRCPKYLISPPPLADLVCPNLFIVYDILRYPRSDEIACRYSFATCEDVKNKTTLMAWFYYRKNNKIVSFKHFVLVKFYT